MPPTAFPVLVVRKRESIEDPGSGWTMTPRRARQLLPPSVLVVSRSYLSTRVNPRVRATNSACSGVGRARGAGVARGVGVGLGPDPAVLENCTYVANDGPCIRISKRNVEKSVELTAEIYKPSTSPIVVLTIVPPSPTAVPLFVSENETSHK